MELTPTASAVETAVNPNELNVRWLGTGLNMASYAGFNSASRLQMFTNHVGQALVVSGIEPDRLQTGVEREYGKYTFKKEFPCNATIIDVVKKYQPKGGIDYFRQDNQLIIYENFETKEIDYLDYNPYHQEHGTFGIKFDVDPVAMQRATTPRSNVREGTTIARSPGLKADGSYGTGLNVRVAFLTVPGVIEDGFIISESFRKRIETRFIGTRSISWGKNQYPINLYGDKDNYKPFPKPGDKVRPDGLLMAFRTYDKNMSLAEMHAEAVMATKVNRMHDTTIYAEEGGAEITDIDVIENFTRDHVVPRKMSTLPSMFSELASARHQRIIDIYRRLRKERGRGLRMSKKFHKLVVNALADRNTGVPHRVQKTMAGAPMDDFWIEIKYTYTKKPTIGYKLTDMQGSKGVLCGIWPDEDMPVTADGKRAELIMDPISVIKRSNIGQLYEVYVNSATEYVSERVVEMMKTDRNAAYEYLMGYYETVSPPFYRMVQKYVTNQQAIDRHLDSIRKEGIYLYLPPDSENIGVAQIQGIREKYPFPIGPVTYRGKSGRMVTTKQPVILGTKYMMVQEKIGDDWSAVSVALLQHHGLPTRVNRINKYANPTRESAVRGAGEAEIRLFLAVSGMDFVAELLDRNNSPITTKLLTRGLLEANQPTNVENLVDREQHPLGSGRGMAYVRHLLACQGIEFRYKEYDPFAPAEVTYD